MGRSPCILRMMSRITFGISGRKRLENAVRARCVIGAGHQRATAGFFHAGGDRLSTVATTTGPSCRLRPPHDMDDHRLARDVGKRFAGQPGRGHAGGDENENVGHCCLSAPVFGSANVAGCVYTGCQRRGKPVICAPPQALLLPVTSISAARKPARNGSFELNKIHGRRSWVPAFACWRSISRPVRSLLQSSPRSPAMRSPSRRNLARPNRPSRSRSNRSSSYSPMRTSAAARTPQRNVSPAIPSTKAAATWSVPTSGPSSVGRRHPRRALIIHRRSKARAAIGPWRSSPVHRQSEGNGARHQHDVCGDWARRVSGQI